ncbi:somatostatin receptor type 4 [Rhipicephalus sanguineus]|uniref:G-protein coupled receptors family 1 profile domain-containing protein n=1 Tax=Rhipicephalus sanguineus TaxID=34632 RepID=A0A9D4YPF7_RHISA|nr:somatostatin receptor type 4 [Rhipicephalus sanguineus]KAH7983399.1 hypothetical protein HPB52_011655 [Rhipicephalus sanguineus]
MEYSWSGRQLPYSAEMGGIGPLFYVAFAVLLVPGVVGNLSVVLMACCYPRLRTPAGIYVVNVAIADLLVCAFGVLLDPVSVLLRRWPFREALCYACSFSEHLGVFVHGYTLVVAAARFVAGRPPKPRSCHLNNAGVWFLGTVVCLPQVLFVDARALAVHGQCVVKWPAMVKMVEPFISFAALSASPFLLVSALYAWLRASVWLGRGTRRSFARRASIVRVFWLMALLLLLCRTPLHVTRCLLGVWTAMRASTHVTVVVLATRAIAAAVVCFTAAFFFDLSAKQLSRRATQVPSVAVNHG